MLQSYSIKDLYSIALAEGEGMGTAYEYFAKRLVLGQWLANQPRPKSILIAGLPERYGASLDFFLLATELGADVTVVDDRPGALAHLDTALATLKMSNAAPFISPPRSSILIDLSSLISIRHQYDLILSSEVIQRLSPTDRLTYWANLLTMSDAIALFTPNADNDAHTTISGLSGLNAAELHTLVESGGSGGAPHSTAMVDYIDMPPFPPGITRSAEQREQATKGWFEATAMWGLGVYARLEGHFPSRLRQSRAHIIYAFVPA
jgi:hypothetical protein